MDDQPALPLDLVHHEILTRTSLETSASFRLVSKASRDFTYTSLFRHLYNKRTKTLTGYLVQKLKISRDISEFVPIEQSDSKQPEISLQFIPFPVRILAASKTQDLLFCMDQTYRSYRLPPRFCLCKPSTKQWRLLPNPKTKYSTTSTAMIVLKSKPLWFKIVRISKTNRSVTNRDDLEYDRYRCEVFDSNTWRWKQLEEMKLPFGEHFTSQHAVSVCGALYWLTSEDRVIAFDLEKESCTIFMLPEQMYNNATICEYKGELAVIFEDNKKESEVLELWVMEGHQNKKWYKKEKLSTETVQKLGRFGRPIGFCDAETALIKGLWDLILYNIKDGVSSALHLPSCFFLFDQVFPFQSDLETCDLLMKNQKH